MAPADTIGIGQESMNNLIILDRDGVINEDSDAYIKTLDEWIPLRGSIDAIARLSRAGYTVVVATNQSGIARGYFTVATLDAMHKRLTDLVRDAGLIDQIVTEYGDVTGVPMIGDSLRDLEAGVARGCKPVLVLTGKGLKTQDKGLPATLGQVDVYHSLADFTDNMLKD